MEPVRSVVRCPRWPRGAAGAVACALLVTFAASWTLHGQDPDEASLAMLNLKVTALTQQVAALQQKTAALEQQALNARVKAPFEVVDGAGKPIVKIEALANGRASVTIGSGTGGVTIGVGASGAGSVLVRRADGTVGAEISQQGGRPMGVLVNDGSGQKPIVELRADSRGNGILSIGDPAAGGVTAGVGATSGAGTLIVRAADGGVGAEISQSGGRGMGLLVYGNGGKDLVAELGAEASNGGYLAVAGSGTRKLFGVADKAGPGDAHVTVGAGAGRYGVNVSSQDGTLLAALGEAKNGAGSVSTFDRSGALRAVMNGLHGEIHVVDGSGTSRATMAADNNQGAFSIRNASGTTILRVGEGQGGGLLQIANTGGNAMVEAGIFPAGAGIVRTYPLGSPGGGMVGLPGTFIMGRLGQK